MKSPKVSRAHMGWSADRHSRNTVPDVTGGGERRTTRLIAPTICARFSRSDSTEKTAMGDALTKTDVDCLSVIALSAKCAYAGAVSAAMGIVFATLL